jgi:hypothetical protein
MFLSIVFALASAKTIDKKKKGTALPKANKASTGRVA